MFQHDPKEVREVFFPTNQHIANMLSMLFLLADQFFNVQSAERTCPEWPEIAGSKRFQANGSRKQ